MSNMITLWINCVHPFGPSGFFSSVLPLQNWQVFAEDKSQPLEDDNILLILLLVAKQNIQGNN